MKTNEELKELVGRCADVEVYYYKFKNGNVHSDNLGGTELEANDIPLDFTCEEMDIFEMDEEYYSRTVLANTCERANFAEWYDNADAKVLVIVLKEKSYKLIMNRKSVIGRVLNSVKDAVTNGNQMLVCSVGKDQKELLLPTDDLLTERLRGMCYVGSNVEPGILSTSPNYNPIGYNIHRFEDEDGSYLLIGTTMGPVDVEMEGVMEDAKATEDEEYYFIQLDEEIRKYDKTEWEFWDAVKDMALS